MTRRLALALPLGLIAGAALVLGFLAYRGAALPLLMDGWRLCN